MYWDYPRDKQDEVLHCAGHMWRGYHQVLDCFTAAVMTGIPPKVCQQLIAYTVTMLKFERRTPFVFKRKMTRAYYHEIIMKMMTDYGAGIFLCALSVGADLSACWQWAQVFGGMSYHVAQWYPKRPFSLARILARIIGPGPATAVLWSMEEQKVHYLRVPAVSRFRWYVYGKYATLKT